MTDLAPAASPPAPTPQPRGLLQTMRWYDGFVIALANPGFIIASLGFTIGSLGALGALAVWLGSMVLGVLQNKIYTEPATMFPDRSGGVAVYAYEGWRSRFSLAGPIAAVGYWAGWTSVLAIFGLTAGSLIQAQWFSDSTWGTSNVIHLDLPRLIAIGLILLVWVVNTFGVKPAKILGYLTGGLLMIPLALLMIVPFFTADWEGSNLSWGLWGAAGGSTWTAIRLVLVWLYLNGWSAYGVEVCASFAPEYHDPHRDTQLALRRSAMFSLIVYAILPLGVGGALSQDAIAGDPVTYYVTILKNELGSALSGVVVVFIIASFVLAMNTATMDGSRALYGISRSGMTIKWFDHINKHHVPSRGMHLDTVVNILLVLFLPTTIAILAASNLGYILCTVLGLSAVVLLRRDRPHWPRPIKLANGWIVAAGVLAGVNLLLLVVGSTSFSLTGYGGMTEFLIGIATLVVACLLYLYRQLVEEKRPLVWRDREVVVAEPPPGALAPEV